MNSLIALLGIFVIYMIFVLFVTVICKTAIPDERFDILLKDIAKWASPILLIALLIWIISNIYAKF